MPLPLRIAALAAAVLLGSCALDGPPPAAALPVPAASPTDAALADAERRLATGDDRGARAAISRLPADLGFSARARRQIIEAELALRANKPLVALQTLPRPWQVSEPALSARIERLRGIALFRAGDTAGAVRTLVAREKLLTTPDALDDNRALLWDHLHDRPLGDAATRAQQTDRVTRGWIELARVKLQPSPSAVTGWRQQYPDHPGERLLEGGEFKWAEPETPPVAASDAAATGVAAAVVPDAREYRMALLLPLTGPFAASAEAVRDGFLSAYFSTGATPVRVQVYDAGHNTEVMRDAYAQALADGARLIIGPMRKDDVAALAEQGEPPVPVLALNYLDPGQAAPGNFYQWGLAPEDEARQAAAHAAQENRLHALALVPEGDWGDRVLAAFAERVTASGGSVLETQRYATADKDHAAPIRDLLNVNDSEERHRALTGILGTPSEFEPRRRGDADFIFFAARGEQAREIAPQLRFHRASGLPVYGLAQWYDGGNVPADLNGVRFCDAPWMVATGGHWQDLRQQMVRSFPTRKRDNTRLLALGHDAYSLAAMIGNRSLSVGTPQALASGTALPQDDGRIARGLDCVEVSAGALKPLTADAR